jgi:hypothetical protein
MYAVSDPPSNELIVLSEVSRALAEARTLPEVKGMRDRAEAVRVFAKSAHMCLSIQNLAAEIKLRAERKAGEMIAEFHMHGGDRRSSLHDGNLKLDDLGISPHQSHRWQKEATVPETEFERFLREAEAHGIEVTAAGLLRLAQRLNPDNKQSPPSRSRKAKGPNGRSVRVVGASRPTSVAMVRELIRELTDHRGQLSNILSPVCSRAGVEMKLIERRQVLRLLAESESLLLELGQHLDLS